MTSLPEEVQRAYKIYEKFVMRALAKKKRAWREADRVYARETKEAYRVYMRVVRRAFPRRRTR